MWLVELVDGIRAAWVCWAPVGRSTASYVIVRRREIAFGASTVRPASYNVQDWDDLPSARRTCDEDEVALQLVMPARPRSPSETPLSLGREERKG